ncbi:MAG TPA: energy transducer TonB, partial [Chitinophagaceae bacterium]|nr:energy transducer TonB [Chitinophagaceae bacterium]
MDANKIKDADILDIIFDGRNKEYGAYQLRKTYSGRLLTGLAVMIGAVLLVFIGSVIANAKKDSKTEILVQDVNLADVKQQEEPKPEPPPPPPP